MTTEYRFTCLSCRSCAAKAHCTERQDGIADLLVDSVPGVRSARADIPAQAMRAGRDGAGPDAIEDAMDAIGVLLS